MDKTSLILQHYPLSKAVAYNICSSKKVFDFHIVEECQSCATEAMINAINSYDRKQKASLKTWIIRNIRFAVLDYINNENKHRGNLNIDDFIDSIKLSMNGLDETINSRDLVLKILLYVDRHRQNKRKDVKMALLAHYFDGQLMKDVAEWRGCTPANVSMMFSKLKELIRQEFGDAL